MAALAVGTNVIYLVWLALVVRQPIGYLFLVLETGIFGLVLLFAVNHRRRRVQVFGGTYSLRAIVDVFVTVTNEPIDILGPTVRAAAAIEYPNKRLYILDDGGRPEVERLAKRVGATYLHRPNRKGNPCKAANLNFGLSHSFGNFVLVLDSDQVVKPQIADELLGFFKDPKVAFVATRQRFSVDHHNFNNDHVFYEYMQTGKDADDAAISCGSGVIYRRSSLTAIGGFQEWNLVEDLYTSYVLHSHGYTSIYTNQSYTLGEAPSDLGVIYKQRRTWATDTLRLWIWKAPLFNRNLSLRQRLHYFEIGYIYIVSGLVIPAVYLLNFYSLAVNHPILVGVSWWYLLFKLPALVTSLKLYDELGQGSASSRMWAALFPVFFSAFIRALLYRKNGYHLTAKGLKPGRHLGLIMPQIGFIGIGLLLVVYHLTHYGLTTLLAVNALWLGLMIYWLWSIIPMALHGSDSVQPGPAKTRYAN